MQTQRWVPLFVYLCFNIRRKNFKELAENVQEQEHLNQDIHFSPQLLDLGSESNTVNIYSAAH